MGEKIKRVIEIIGDCILEILYPRENHCIICNEEDCNGICRSCINKIKRIDDKYQSTIISYGYYGGVLKELILQFKYHKNFTAGDILAQFLTEYIKENIDYKQYVITYIPLSKRAEKDRGFNQCEYLAKSISKTLCINYLEILIKIKENKEQKRLRKNERRENMLDVFDKAPEIKCSGLNIILIDDVVTTGATMEEACKILKKYGVKQIKLLTLAKSHI